MALDFPTLTLNFPPEKGAPPPAAAPQPPVSIAWARDLPALPAAVVDLMALLGQEDVDTFELAAKLSVDMALTAKTLRLANSAFYGLRREVTSVPDAISMLGMRMVKGIVTAAALGASIKPPACEGFDFKAFWRHGVATAVGAQMLALAVGADSQAAFTTGLLYNIGQIVLAGQFPDRFADVLTMRAATGADLIGIERQLLGIDHALVGSKVAEHWRFPAAIVEAIGAVDQALEPGEVPTLGHLVAAADRLAFAGANGVDPAAAGPGLAADAWVCAGVASDFWATASIEAARQTDAICAGLQG